MIFGPVATADAAGAILAHALRLDGFSRSKGHVLTDGDIAAIGQRGIGSLIVARLEPGDVLEDAAAARIASPLVSAGTSLSPASTGRVNVFARHDGLFVADRRTIDRVNRIDPAITLACLPDRAPVRTGDMVATVKIIPLAVAGGCVDAAVAALSAASAMTVKPFRPHRTLLVATELPGLKPSVMDKTRRTLEARLRRLGSPPVTEIRVAHDEAALARVLAGHANAADLVIVFGASAVTDPADVIPGAIRMAGGRVIHVGMPVDPGNLLVLGRIGAVPVIGAPGCARSPKENGFDWILQRILAGEDPGPDEITGLGVGGLLMEISTRPQPRDAQDAEDAHDPAAIPVATIVLAAGRASRMGAGGHHKLLAEFGGVPLVRRSVETALAVPGADVTVVTGHREGDIRDALSGLGVRIVHNPDHASGMASSLIAGLDAVGKEIQGILVLLADMPAITDGHLTALIEAFRAKGGQAIVRASAGEKRGNPVILPRSTFDAIRRLSGDVGARPVIETSGLPVVDIDIGDAARLDLDTAEAVIAAGGSLRG
ncbi:NTP transferase domain-containing protein [Ensifer soli]|uniref:NTP transferase domain-containing protein n=1 Tax=Ciceribacter sp. sgz301302 TaxID=3342379 RepID=UPI0035BA7793